jgi:hypothetical protein
MRHTIANMQHLQPGSVNRAPARGVARAARATG